MKLGKVTLVQPVTILLIFVLLYTATIQAEERRPLLMAGKTNLYQKVLTRPSATLSIKKDDGSFSTGNPLAPFTIFHVYQRLYQNGAEWLEVGSGFHGKIDGWITSDQVIDWKQSIVAVFGNPAGRSRLPLFRERGFAEELLSSKNAAPRSEAILAKLTSGEIAPDSPAISIEPENYVDFRENFYLLPILEAERFRNANNFSMRLLNIASVPEQGGNSVPSELNSDKNLSGQFKTGIAFVLDATTSMGPYIERTRQTIQAVYDQLESRQLTDRVGFGIVAFRDNVEASPGLEFVTRVISNLRDGRNRDDLLKRARSVKPAKVSSRHFREDAYAGVITAIENLDWDEYAGRFIVLITDAPPREAGDQLSQTGLNAVSVRSRAAEKGIVVFVIHLLTPEGRDTHETASDSYTLLSQGPDNTQPYYGVPYGGTPQAMGRAIDATAEQLVTQVGCLASHDQSPCDFEEIGRSAAKKFADEPELARLQKDTARIGHAMALAYFGREQGTRAPDLFTAWIADRDISNPQNQALEIRVLLTKNQLSDLQEALRTILAAGEKSQLAPKDFFDEIQSAAAVFARAPNQGIRGRFRNLQESGLLGEFLDGLPYRSQVLHLTQELWESWSVGEQQEFLDAVQAKIRLYKRYHDDVNQWRSLGHTPSPGDAVYPIPLDNMP